ncbi:unnamed protein product [Malus baccata var. baccata]
MATKIEVEIIESQTVKPSSPTPHQLRNFNLSVLDQMAPVVHVPLLLFYPNIATTHSMAMNERCQLLIQSLAKALTHFYPLAGRLVEGSSTIECNDDGAEFIIARVNCSLADILEPPDVVMLNQFLPTEGKGPMLLVQVNFFECGGMAIGFKISHKFADGSTVFTFIKYLSTIALQSSDSDQVVLPPEFGAASHFPPLDFSNSSQPTPMTKKFHQAQKCVTERYVFDASKISTLKSDVASSIVPNPTRVEAVSALIWKCAMEASRSNSESPRPSMFHQGVNLRKRFVPPLPENLAGNIVGRFTSKVEEFAMIDLKDLAAKLRKGIEQMKEKYAAKVLFDSNVACQERTDFCKNVLDNDGIENYACTSWCRFPYYETDFGWGKPAWVSLTSFSVANVIALLDKRDCKGLEAWVTMSEETMAILESNVELLGYASVNPSVTY